MKNLPTLTGDGGGKPKDREFVIGEKPDLVRSIKPPNPDGR